MDFDVRPLNDTDYDNLLKGWWEDWGWKAPPKDFLPESGYMVMDGDTPVCAGFLYYTNASVVLLEFIISNKSYRKKPERTEAIQFLINFLTEMCRLSDKKYVFSMLKSIPLIDKYEKAGYVKGDKHAQEMIKVF